MGANNPMFMPLRDTLIINGKKIPLVFSPAYLNPPGYSNYINPSLPPDHPRIILRPSDEERSTADKVTLHNGHQATWELKENGCLYLAVLYDYFRKFQGDEPLLADWVSGSIQLPDEQEIHLKHGKVVNLSNLPSWVKWIQKRLLGKH